MKLIIVLCISLVMAATCAQGAASTNSYQRPANFVYPMERCHIRISTAPKRWFSPDGKYGTYMFDNGKYGAAWGFSLTCQAGASQDEIDTTLDAKQVNGRWLWVDGGSVFEEDQHFHIFFLAGKNWTGTGTTYDQTTGDESTRQRYFQFCLVETHWPQMLCGREGVSLYDDVELNRILAVLKTIEFVDPPAANPDSTSGH